MYNSIAILLVTTLIASAYVEQAYWTQAYLDSVGINPTMDWTNYDKSLPFLLQAGIRHVRLSQSGNKTVTMYKDLAAHGIKTMLLLDFNYGVRPNVSFFVRVPGYDTSDPSPGYLLHDFVKLVGPGSVIDAVEMPNEIDASYSQVQQFWHPEDFPKNHISNDPSSPFYWVKFIIACTEAAWNALKSDPETAMVKVVGFASGQTYGGGPKNPVPANSMKATTDYGAFHPYPGSGNFATQRFPYATVNWYYGNTIFPSVNLYPYSFSFDNYQPPFGTPKPMYATETGYTTRYRTDFTTFNRDIGEDVHAKMVPRLYLEYFLSNLVRGFNNGVACTYLFNLRDFGGGPYGLLHEDYTPKPAFYAVSNLHQILNDKQGCVDYKPTTLDYTITVTPVKDYVDPVNNITSTYDRTEFVHHLLLQKCNGDFFLTIWHETAPLQVNTMEGNVLVPGHLVQPPLMPTTITLPTSIETVTGYLPNTNTNGFSVKIQKNSTSNFISVNVPDVVLVLQLQVAPHTS